VEAFCSLIKMENKGFLLLCVVGSFLVVGCIAESVTWSPCTKTNSERNAAATIHAVNVDPCPAAPEGPCAVPVGSSANITMELTPGLRCGRRCRHMYYWERSGSMDLPFKGLSAKACDGFFDCAKDPNTRQTYKASLPIRSSFPLGRYPVKIKLYTGAKVVACIIVPIELVQAAN